MDSTTFHSILLLLSTLFLLPLFATSIGINYGQIGDNLPPPAKVIPLIKSIGASKVKLYDASPQVLHAFANTGIEFIVGLGNEYLDKMRDLDNAQAWVKQNVESYLPATKITCITIGNEVLTFNDTSLTDHLVPAMESVHTALVNLNLDKQVRVTTAHSLAVLETSYPPSSGVFRRDLVNCMTQILSFHMKTGSPFLINAYPYFAYKANPKQVSLDYVLFQPNAGVTDPVTKLHYENMLFAQIDAVYAALAVLGFKKLPIQISETGWPSNGGADEAGATCENAMRYNGNLIKMMMKKKTRTPMRPECDLNIYLFALFNENQKPGPASERNYGLFNPDGKQVYSLPKFQSQQQSSTNTTGSGSGSGSITNKPLAPERSADYLSISTAPKTCKFTWPLFFFCIKLLSLIIGPRR